MDRNGRCRLYLVTPPALDPAVFASSMVAALDAGDVACIQLWLPDAPDDDLLAAAQILGPLAQARGAAFLVGERPEIAKRAGADGAHLGPNTMPADAARRLLGPDSIVGVSCLDSRHRAMVAAEAGADYVSFGAFYPSPTKPSSYRPDLDLLTWWQEIMTIPAVAIGGITPDNLAPLAVAGADFVAAVSAVWSAEAGPAAAVAAFNKALDAAAAAKEEPR